MSINAHEYFCLRLTLAQQGIQVRSISGEPQTTEHTIINTLDLSNYQNTFYMHWGLLLYILLN